MSWAMNESGWEKALDRYLTEPPQDEEPIHICSNCDEPIYEGEEYYDIPTDGIYCEKCVSDWKCTAWRK